MRKAQVLTFKEKFSGMLHGVLKWDDVEALWQFLGENSKGWYVFDPAGDVPEEVLDKEAFDAFLEQSMALTNKRRARPFCGSIYVDDKEAPTFIKIFDPTNMGSSCSCSVESVLPAFVVSKLPPEPLIVKVPETVEKPGLFKRIFGHA